jgi:hypothetical protein
MVRAADMEVIEGPVESWAPPEANRPGKLLIRHGQDVVELTIWPDKDTGGLPTYADGLDFDQLIGGKIQALAVFKDEYQGVKCYRPSKIKAIDSAPTAKAKPQPQKPAPEPEPSDGYDPTPREDWSAQGQAKGNTRNVAGYVIGSYVQAKNGLLPDVEWIQAAAAAVNTFSHYCLSDATLLNQDGVSASDEDESLAVISA